MRWVRVAVSQNDGMRTLAAEAGEAFDDICSTIRLHYVPSTQL